MTKTRNIQMLIILLLLSSCIAVRPGNFHETKTDIYHVSYRQDTIVLTWQDIRILKIDTLKTKYLELKAER